jgi:DNA repair exonuclease SbcCD nuclease subunit
VKILCAGDLHIGRRSSRLPQHLDIRAHAAAAAWARVVELALERRVDLLLLSGDLVDRANRFYEALGPFEAGLRRLAGEGIQTIAVAGNHDFDVLPRLADAFDADAFRLLGRGGRWERVTVRRGEHLLHVDGWSFPDARVRESPVRSYALPPADGVPVLGLLHADLDQPRSPYAPVMRAELRAVPVHFWLLGHVHAPALHTAPGAAPILYPGSVQALDPGEPGAHGAWLLELRPGARFDTTLLPLSTVRYESLEVDVSEAGDAEALDRLLTDAVRARLAALVQEGGPLRALSLRLRAVGRSALHRTVGQHLEHLRELELTSGDVVAVVERTEAETRPALDLSALAGGSDAPAVLARLLLALEGEGTAPGDELALVLRSATSKVEAVCGTRHYRSALGPEADLDESAAASFARQALARQGALLLDHLLAQKEAR